MKAHVWCGGREDADLGIAQQYEAVAMMHRKVGKNGKRSSAVGCDIGRWLLHNNYQKTWNHRQTDRQTDRQHAARHRTAPTRHRGSTRRLLWSLSILLLSIVLIMATCFTSPRGRCHVRALEVRPSGWHDSWDDSRNQDKECRFRPMTSWTAACKGGWDPSLNPSLERDPWLNLLNWLSNWSDEDPGGLGGISTGLGQGSDAPSSPYPRTAT